MWDRPVAINWPQGRGLGMPDILATVLGTAVTTKPSNNNKSQLNLVKSLNVKTTAKRKT